MTDEELRNYLGVLSFLLAALAFLANERRDAIGALHRRNDVTSGEKWLAFFSVLLLLLATVGLLASAWPAVKATGLGPGDLLRLEAVVRQAFVMGWVLLIAVTLALGALVLRAYRVGVRVGQ
jgi:hypothetical protein